MAPSVQLNRALAAYEWEPTPDRAAAVWEALAEVDGRIGELKGVVSRNSGGVRAEAEIERIELERLREEQLVRFAGVQARLRTARAAFDALASSTDTDGIRAAASMVIRGSSSEDRFSARDLRLGRSGLPMQTQ
jgi:hypothetical protein